MLGGCVAYAFHFGALAPTDKFITSHARAELLGPSRGRSRVDCAGVVAPATRVACGRLALRVPAASAEFPGGLRCESDHGLLPPVP